MPLEAGGTALIEVEEEAGAAVTRGVHPREVIETVGNSFEAALEAIKPVAVAVASKFRNFADAPEDAGQQEPSSPPLAPRHSFG